MAGTPTPRRWFRFSLRTLFVVITLFGIWLGWEIKYIHERKAAVQWFRENNWFCVTVDQHQGDRQGHSDPRVRMIHEKERREHAISFWRRLLGDDAYFLVGYLPDAQDDDIERAKRLFPEAYVKGMTAIGSSFQIDIQQTFP